MTVTIFVQGHAISPPSPKLTELGAADISSRKPDLLRNADGSVVVTFALVQPVGAANWIKTTPGEAWFAYFRFYAPSEAYFSKACKLNVIEYLQP